MTTFYLVDNDESVCTTSAGLLRSANMQVHSLTDVKELLRTNKPDEQSCVVADNRIPGIDGFDLIKMLAARDCKYPVIFLSAQDTEQTRTAAKRASGAEFFRKLIDAQALLDAIEWVIREDKDNGQVSH